MSGDAAVPSRGLLVQLEDALWASLPGRIWRRTPSLGLILADGGWLRAWPGVALAGPAVGFLLGAFRGGWRPEHEVTYGYSLLWLLVLLVVALSGCGVALWTWLGFILADLLVFDHPPVRPEQLFGDPSLTDQVRQFLLPHLVSYLLLGVLLLGTPLIALVARGSVIGLLSAAPGRVRIGFGATAAAVAAGLHAGLWTQAYPFLIRPVWTWRDRFSSVDPAGIQPIQENPLWLGFPAAAAAAGWAVLSFVALQRITGQRYQPIARPQADSHPVWSVAGTVLKAGLVTLLLGGIMPRWWHGLITFVVLLAAFLAQQQLLPRTPAARWWTATLPAALRLAIAVAVAWVIAWQISTTAYDERFGRTVITTDAFDPLLWAIVAGIAVVALLLPAVRGGQQVAPAERPGGQP